MCGSTAILVSYILGIQCQAGGLYTVRVLQNGGEVAAGTASYSVMVSYGAIDPTTFHAELNGAVVTELFTPTPGSTQTVALPLVTGRNVLLLSVAGGPGGPTGTDRDRLVFLLP